MPIAIHEDDLRGSTPLEKFQHARELGAQGVELWGAGLTERVPAIVAAMQQTGLRTAAINHGRQRDLLDPDPDERERALKQLRESITNAVDLDAAGVVFVPTFGESGYPDLSPWMSAPELEVEMLYMHLRILSDFSEALGTNLYIAPIRRSETHLLNRLEQAARITRRLNHPRVQIAADLAVMALEESDIPAALLAHGDCIKHVYAAESSDLPAAAAALREIGYGGWTTFSGASLDALKQAGFS
ncbi:MAG: TIM barrel protein [Chloroflexi bacterium]|nr:TIM barrel protein [Chloroflexota bacterium]